LVKSRPGESDSNDESPQALMGNTSARRSTLEIGAMLGDDSVRSHENGRNDADPTMRPKPRGLQAKSGIILVSGSPNRASTEH
jgi:hypothetical protein